MSQSPRLMRPALVLALIGLAAALVLAGLNELTRDRIADEQHKRALAAISYMLPVGSYNNRLLDDHAEIFIGGLEAPVTVYRARLNGEPVAAVFDVTTARGYSGDIRLLVAIAADGTVIGVRALEHRETPGLGDRIEARRSPWILQFAGRSLGDPSAERWAPDQRGGDFDTLTRATITAAAVTDAVRRVLQAFEEAGESLFATPAHSDLTAMDSMDLYSLRQHHQLPT